MKHQRFNAFVFFYSYFYSTLIRFLKREVDQVNQENQDQPQEEVVLLKMIKRNEKLKQRKNEKQMLSGKEMPMRNGNVTLMRKGNVTLMRKGSEMQMPNGNVTPMRKGSVKLM